MSRGQARVALLTSFFFPVRFPFPPPRLEAFPLFVALSPFRFPEGRYSSKSLLTALQPSVPPPPLVSSPFLSPFLPPFPFVPPFLSFLSSFPPLLPSFSSSPPSSFFSSWLFCFFHHPPFSPPPIRIRTDRGDLPPTFREPPPPPLLQVESHLRTGGAAGHFLV